MCVVWEIGVFLEIVAMLANVDLNLRLTIYPFAFGLPATVPGLVGGRVVLWLCCFVAWLLGCLVALLLCCFVALLLCRFVALLYTCVLHLDALWKPCG